MIKIFECHQCKERKGEGEYYPSSIKKQDYTCKSCSVIRGKQYRDKRTARNDMNSRYSYAKCSAKQNKKPFLLTKDEYKKLASRNCIYCNSPSGGLGVGLDRIDNDKSIGYTVDNVLPCCRDCNVMRGDRLTVEETKVAVEAILKHRQDNGKR